MIGAIVFFVLLFGYFGIVKGESDSLKVFLAIIGIVAVVWLIGSFSNDNNGMTDADYEKIRIYEENHKNWNTEIASTVFGIDKPESYDDMKPYVDSVFSYITPDATLPQILSWIQECTTVSGEFDYEKANFSFEITDLTATAKEMHITEKMLGYVLAVIDEYGPEENFKGNI